MLKANNEHLPPLDMHRRIEDMENEVRQMNRESAAFHDLVSGYIEKIQASRASGNSKELIDVNGDTASSCVQMEDMIRSRLPWIEKLEVGCENSHMEQLKELYRKLVTCSEELLSAVQQLRWEISEHDADLEIPLPEKFAFVEEFLATLKA